jgi:hypothetical protein
VDENLETVVPGMQRDGLGEKDWVFTRGVPAHCSCVSSANRMN